MNARPYIPSPPDPGFQPAVLINQPVATTITAFFRPEPKGNPPEEIEEHLVGVNC